MALGPQDWLVYGLRGHVFRTKDGGCTLDAIDTGTTQGMLGATRLKDGSVVLVGNGGIALISDPALTSFTPISHSENADAERSCRGAGRHLVAVGDDRRFDRCVRHRKPRGPGKGGREIMRESFILRLVRGIEGIVFSARPLIITLFCLATLFFLAGAIGLLQPIGIPGAHIEGGLDKQAPSDHPYILTAKKYAEQIGSGNVLLIGLEAKSGTMFSGPFIDELSHVADDVFYLPGVDRAHLTYMFGPNVLVLELAEDGFHASRVLPDDFKPSEESFATLKANLIKGGLVGRLVSDDFSTALIVVPLLEHDPRTGAPLDYIAFAHKLENDIKSKYEAQYPDVRIRITGFARAVGEIADGAAYVVVFFLVALIITAFLLYRVSHHWWLTRRRCCVRSRR
jgi:hypothetical protein